MSAGRSLAGVAVPIYLATEGYSATHLGVVFGVAAAASALMSAGIGFLSDRLGRRLFMVVVPLLAVAAALAYAFSVSTTVVLVGAALGSFGRGSGAGGGTVGPYQPAEQALVAASVEARRRTAAFGRLAFASSLGALGGGLLTGVLAPSHPARQAALGAYRPVFLALAGCATVAGLLALLIVEPSSPKVERRERGPLFPRRSAGLLYRLWITNTLNGAALGMFGPFLSYWFFRRFGVGAGELGFLYAVVNATSTVSNLSAASVARRLGLVRGTVVLRALVAGLIVPMVFAPSFWIAGAIYLLRMAGQRVVMPLRQSYVMGMAAPEERARLAALSTLPSQAASASTPTLAGALFEVALGAPFLIAGALQLGNAILYYAFFHGLAPEEERAAPARAGGVGVAPALRSSTRPGPPPALAPGGSSADARGSP